MFKACNCVVWSPFSSGNGTIFVFGGYKDFVPNSDWKSIAQQIRSRQGINYSVPLVSIPFLITKGLV